MDNLALIRKEMDKNNVDLWIGHSYDAHSSEYICEHDNVIKFASGFTGENGTLAVFACAAPQGNCDNEMCGAYLWVDGRFFIQAPKETEGKGITIMKMDEPGVPKFSDWLEDKKVKGLKISEDPELIDPAWKDRPKRPCNKIWIHSAEYEDRSAAEKIEEVRRILAEKKEAIWIRKLDEIAWLTNLRGSDIDYNPVFFSYMYIDMNRAVIFLQEHAADDEVKTYLSKNGIDIKSYNEAIKPENAVESNIITDLKACKTESEASHMEECNIRDAAVLTKFIYSLKKLQPASSKAPETLTELEAGQMLDGMRSENERFLGLAFPTICAYGEHGAIIHYRSSEKTNIAIENKSFLLVDSGAHYLDGTTDVTRTIAMGKLTYEEKKHYTLVMMGMLRLMNAAFDEDTDSSVLNDIARKPLIDNGLNFNHGVGHGIGYLNVVHEDPVRIFKTKTGFTFKAGMVVSNEPGVYIEKSHGVRIENMLICLPKNEGLGWKNLTWAPLEREAVLPEIMTAEDIKYYNEYQSEVKRRLAPFMTDEELEWLNSICSSI